MYEGRADSKLKSFVWLISSKHESFPLWLRGVFQLWRCEHSRHVHTHWRPGLNPHACPAQEQVLPPFLHGQEPSTPIILPPLGTFTHPLHPTKPCSSFHSCPLLLSKGHTSAAISSASTLRLSASSREHSPPDYSLNISQPEGAAFLVYHFPLNYFSVIMYWSNTHTNFL